MSLATESPGMATRSDAQNHVASKLTTPQLHRALLTSEPSRRSSRRSDGRRRERRPELTRGSRLESNDRTIQAYADRFEYNDHGKIFRIVALLPAE